MAAASVILVLAWVPYIEIKSFKPLGFDFNEGGELSVWGILAVVLVYYAVRSCYEYWMDYNGWMDTYRVWLGIAAGTANYDKAHIRHVRRLKRKFWFMDVAPPALMFPFVLVATYQQLAPLVKPLL